MALNFPANPTIGQTFAFGQVLWTWSGTSWVGSTTANASILTISDSPPSSPTANSSVWWQSNTGFLKIYYTDGNGSQWVDATPHPLPNPLPFYVCSIPYNNSDPAGKAYFTAHVPMTVRAISGRVDQANASTATANVFIAANGTSISTSGIMVNQFTFFASGTGSSIQMLSVNSGNAIMNVGDSIGVVTSGAWSNSTGCITIILQQN